MADIAPFAGYRFSLESPDMLGARIAPPYDMLDKAMIDALYEKDPHNIVRVTQNKPESTDKANKDRHVRAASVLSQWMAEGVMAQDAEPSVYLYEQKFTLTAGTTVTDYVRTGVVVRVKLVDFEEKVVLPHEATLSGPKIDRYELLEASLTHTEQIFGLLADEGDFYRTLRTMVKKVPDGVFTDANGVLHSLYRCTDAATIAKLVALAKGKTILIADGHHRYETGLNYHKATNLPGSEYTMMTLVSTADPGLVIRPFHRLVKKAGTAVAMKKALASYFDLTPCGTASVDQIYTYVNGSGGDVALLYVDSGDKQLYECVLNAKGEAFLASVMPEHSMLWKKLPVSMINVIVINTILGLPLDGHVLHDVIDYVNDAATGLGQCADSAVYHGGFFIRPSTIATVGGIVAAGERMPQKSTNFFPKIYSGLVLYRMGA